VVNRLLLGVYRGALHLYPRTFRQEYGDELVRAALDQCTFGGRSPVSVVVRELPDVAGSALRMRGENPMSRFAVSVVVLVAGIAAALAGGPIALVPMAAVAVAVFMGMRDTPPIEVRSGHPARWLVTAVGAIGVAVAIPVIDGGELSEPAWAAMAVLLIGGVGLALTGLGQLMAGTRGSAPSTTR
jgi:hypothetical protein